MLYMIRILTIALFICGSKCSQVIDIHSQKVLNVSDYCPKIGECGEGAHVMCLYNSARVMGPACYDYLTNIIITPDYAQLIITIINRIRSRIANGQVKVKDGVPLPKGYGIYRVAWDQELATFAQVWANQCILRLDLCRSSKRFPYAGQALGMTRLSLDDWMPIHKSDFNETTLTPEKVKYAVKSVLKAWWDMKEVVTVGQVKEYNISGPAMLRNKFLNLIYGPLTHVGCGISVYKEYAYKDNMAHLFFNCIQIVCNFSARPRYGKPIFEVKPPTEHGYTVRCGCPVGYDEDDDCLCHQTGRYEPYYCKDKDRCKPSVVVLPIFTVEDAPILRVGDNNTTLRETKNDNLLFDRFDKLNNRMPLNNYDIFNNVEAINYKSDSIRRFPSDVRSRYFNGKPRTSFVHNTTKAPHSVAGVTHAGRHVLRQKQSIFSKAGIFELPIKSKKLTGKNETKKGTNNLVHQPQGFKKDVAPRKDFTKIQKLATSYLDKKRNGKPFDLGFTSDGYMSHGPVTIISNNNTAKENPKYTNQKVTYLNTFNVTKDELKYSNLNTRVEGDTKLITLLDKLEEEVKKNDLNSNEKGMFDKKIRKIYRTLVGKLNLVDPKFKLLSKGSMNESITGDIEYHKSPKVDQINVDQYGLNFNKPKQDYPDYENNYNSLTKYENRLDRTYDNKIFNREAKSLSRGIIENVEDRNLRNTYDVRENFKSHHENRHSRTEADEYYPLSSEKRRYYHQKLANLQKKLKNIKRSRHLKEVPENIRHVRPTKQEKQQRRRRPNEHVNTYYMPDRARFLHGF